MKPYTFTRSLLAGAIVLAVAGCVETGSDANHSSESSVGGDDTGGQNIPQSSDTRVNFDP